MKIRYKHIRFEKVMGVWLCRNIKSNHPLGGIEYYPKWKKWVMNFDEHSVFDEFCLRDIADFLTQLNDYSTEGKE